MYWKLPSRYHLWCTGHQKQVALNSTTVLDGQILATVFQEVEDNTEMKLGNLLLTSGDLTCVNKMIG